MESQQRRTQGFPFQQASENYFEAPSKTHNHTRTHTHAHTHTLTLTITFTLTLTLALTLTHMRSCTSDI